MLKTSELLEKINIKEDREKYADMISQVNLPDFYKCVAQFSGLSMNEICDATIVKYIYTWAENKYRFYKMLGNKIRVDVPFTYQKTADDRKDSFDEIAKKFPAYALWLNEFKRQSTNNINYLVDLSNLVCNTVRDLFPHYNLCGSSVTHFFKSKLNAPEALVTAIGRVYELNDITLNYCASIDPVDMLLASENPYNWDSCYRLEVPNDSSHADGCMAAILDKTELITYLWSSEGKFDLYGFYKFKNIRYKRMRAWIAISDDFSCIHFNKIYPGKDGLNEEFYKKYRDIIEKMVADYKGVTNVWRHNRQIQLDNYWRTYVHECRINRDYYYGYGEFDSDNIYINNELFPKIEDAKDIDEKVKTMIVYDTKIECACGCGMELFGSDDGCSDDYEEYNGEGFNHSSWAERPMWCEESDEECEMGRSYDDGCLGRECPLYNRYNPICPCTKERCDEANTWQVDEDTGLVDQNEEVCIDCEHWHHCKNCGGAGHDA